MKILCIDTSSNICSVALLEDTNLIKELVISDSKTHSENLMPLVKELLDETRISLNEINLIACDNGPGSFTGIRIGIATIKAFSEVYNIPVIGISSLECLAYNSSSETICSLIDAKNNQVYCGIFNSDYSLLEDYIADDINTVISHISKYSNVEFVGDGSTIHKELLVNSFPTSTFCTDNAQHATNLGKCAFIKYSLGKKLDSADTILPMYLRKSQAERMKKNPNE